MTTYGIVIDDDMLINVLETDIKESHDLLSWKLFFTVFIFFFKDKMRII